MFIVSNILSFSLKSAGLVLTRKRNVDPAVRLSLARQHILDVLDIDHVYDIGANRGQWALELLRNGYRHQIFSFEPTKKAFRDLVENTAKSKNWHAVNAAIGPHIGIIPMHVTSNDELSSSFYELGLEHTIAAPHAEFIGDETVQMIRLDDYFSSDSRSFVKIDTQGYELEIIKAIPMPAWKSIRALEVEVSLVQTYVGGPLLEEVTGFLRKLGYRPYRIENGLARSGFGQLLQVDVLFVKEELSRKLN